MNILNKKNIGIVLSLFIISLVVLGSMFSNFTILDFFYLIVTIGSIIKFILIKKHKKIIRDMV